LKFEIILKHQFIRAMYHIIDKDRTTLIFCIYYKLVYTWMYIIVSFLDICLNYLIWNFLIIFKTKNNKPSKILEHSGQSPSLYVQVLSVLLRNVCEIRMLLGPQCKYFFSIQYVPQKTYTYDICETKTRVRLINRNKNAHGHVGDSPWEL